MGIATTNTRMLARARHGKHCPCWVQFLPCFLHVLVDPILGDVSWTSSLFFWMFFCMTKKHRFLIVCVWVEVISMSSNLLIIPCVWMVGIYKRIYVRFQLTKSIWQIDNLFINEVTFDTFCLEEYHDKSSKLLSMTSWGGLEWASWDLSKSLWQNEQRWR